MILIDKKHFNAIILYHLISIIITALYAVFIIHNADLSDVNERKHYSEVIIFGMIIFISLNIPLGVYIYLKSTRIITEFDKIIEFSKLHSFSDQHQSLKHLDVIGVKIIELFKRINDLSNKRIVKLSSLYEIVDHLTTNSDKYILIINVAGDILYVSGLLEKKLNTDKILLQTLNISDIIDLNLKSLLIELDNEKQEVIKNDIKFTEEAIRFKIKKAAAYPIFNSEHYLSNIVFYFDM